MDEFAQLGRLGPIEDALGQGRGYGIALLPVLQDINQLRDLYQGARRNLRRHVGRCVRISRRTT